VLTPIEKESKVYHNNHYFKPLINIRIKSSAIVHEKLIARYNTTHTQQSLTFVEIKF